MFGDEVSFLRHRHTYPDIVESARTFFFPDIACSRLRHSGVHGIEKTRTRKKKKKNRRNSLFSHPTLLFARVSHSRLPHSFAPSPLSERLERAIPDTVSVHTYPVNPAYESATSWIRSPEGNFFNTLWIRNRVDAKSVCFLSGEVTRSSPVLYREYYVQDGNLVPRFS